MKKLVVADILSASTNGKLEGHYSTVAQNYIDIFEGIYDVYVAGGPVYKGKFKRYIALPYDTKKDIPGFLNKVHALKNFWEVMKHEKDSVIVFQCSAVVTIMLGLLLKSTKNKNVFLIQYDQQMISSKFKRMLLSMIRRKIGGIICPGKEIGVNLKINYCVVPDYIYSPKNNSDIGESIEYDFGIYGILAQGKGVLEAANIIADTQYTLRIAGKIGTLPEDKKMIEELFELSQKSNNIKLEIGYLSDNDYIKKIQETKYCILNYDQSYAMRSSGVIFDSLFNCRPVLAKKRKYAQFVEDECIGVVYSSLAEVNFSEVLSTNYYAELQNNIKRYLERQNKSKENLIAFLTI